MGARLATFVSLLLRQLSRMKTANFKHFPPLFLVWSLSFVQTQMIYFVLVQVSLLSLKQYLIFHECKSLKLTQTCSVVWICNIVFKHYHVSPVKIHIKWYFRFLSPFPWFYSLNTNSNALVWQMHFSTVKTFLLNKHFWLISLCKEMQTICINYHKGRNIQLKTAYMNDSSETD